MLQRPGDKISGGRGECGKHAFVVFDMSGMCEQQSAEAIEIVGAGPKVPGTIGQAVPIAIGTDALPPHISGRGNVRRRRPSAIGKLSHQPGLSSDLLRIV